MFAQNGGNGGKKLGATLLARKEFLFDEIVNEFQFAVFVDGLRLKGWVSVGLRLKEDC